jgi:hypothetical protein
MSKCNENEDDESNVSLDETSVNLNIEGNIKKPQINKGDRRRIS